MNRRKLAWAALPTLAFLCLSSEARADATYCSAGLSLAGLTEMQFRGAAADDCFGIAWGSSPADASGLWGGGWSTHLGDGLGERTDSALGLTWTLKPATLLKPTSWSLRTSEAPSPLSVDIVAVVSGYSLWSAYLFTAETFAAADTSRGSLRASFAPLGLPIPHLDVYIRPSAATTVPDGDPGILPMLGLAFAGVVALRRRRFSRSGFAEGLRR